MYVYVNTYIYDESGTCSAATPSAKGSGGDCEACARALVRTDYDFFRDAIRKGIGGF